ncbi:hypothetical protein L226DRAFT_44204 [Lentinus tigrinus ALCF2SS1-7]|uniref:uncharacterized protein n=1 Tax=Lentinus tigrinus ALCF2SS1-7 TaxID=1328758 RepID=UPI001165E3EF|nr:hypothetical protein L226DRAFT_44204 [Lentinus tigrinus ALCF2SS1-7]
MDIIFTACQLQMTRLNRQIRNPTGLSQAHLALARFALPHVRNSIALESYLTIITCNGDGRIKRAIEHFFSRFGLVVPSSDGNVAMWVQRDPLLIELSTRRRHDEDQMRLFGPKDGCISEEEQHQTASRIISNADLLLIAGCLSDVEISLD